MPAVLMSKKTALKRLLNPASIAVFGGAAAAEVIRQCRRIGYAGELYPVNPRRESMEGLTCYASVADLPGVPDAAFIATPPPVTIDVIRQLAALGAGGAVCYTSGFAEASSAGATLQRKLIGAAGEMAIVGPNCHGIVNYLDKVALWPDEHGGECCERGAALILQSGNLGISLSMQDRSLPISHILTVGNKADLSMHDYIEALIDDDRVTAIGLHIEGLENVADFSRAALHALERSVPLVVIKTGTSELGAEITMSHTSSLSGSDGLYNALFQRLGIIRCNSLSQFAETLKLLSVTGPLTGNRIGSVSCSGGEASMIADDAAPLGLEMPPLTAGSADALHEVLGDKVHIVNPLDYHTYIWGDRLAMTRCFTAMLDNRFDCCMLVIDYPREGQCLMDNWEMAEQALIDARDATGQVAVIVSTLPENFPKDARERLLRAGIAPMQGLNECIGAIRGAAEFGRACGNAGVIKPIDAIAARDGNTLALSEWASKKELAGFGLPVPAGVLCTLDTAAASAAELGYPLAAKVSSAKVVHKTDIGGVRLNLADEQQLIAAVSDLQQHSPEILLEKMAPPAIAELIVGVTRDSQFGLALLIGAGGILAELVNDAVSLLLPASRVDIEAALSSLNISNIINGFRGNVAGDREAVVDAIEAVARYAGAHQDQLLELDVNPLLVLQDGAVAVDAFINRIE
jgi:acyl-CoA synthetase (NDP forming)